MRESWRKGHPTLAVGNVVGSTIAREADGGVFLHAGSEIGVASTKAFTAWLRRTLECEEDVKRIPRKYASATSFLYLGRQFLYPVALEGALKLKDISYIHGEGYPAPSPWSRRS